MKVFMTAYERYPHVELHPEPDGLDGFDIPEELYEAWCDALTALETVERAITYAALEAAEIGKDHPLTEQYYVCPHGRSVYGHCHQHKHLPVVGEGEAA